MEHKLKMFKRGKGVTMLQELLQRMGYSMHDRPGLFGVSTRDAVKDFQSKKGLKSTGTVDDELLALMRQNFGAPVTSKKGKSKSASTPALNPVNQEQLDGLIRLLINKGIFTEDELQREIGRPQPLRVTQPPLT